MILYFNGVTYDLTNLIENSSINYTQTIDKTFDRGGFSIPSVKSDYFEDLDMSRPLPRYSRVLFDINGIEINALIQSDIVSRILGTDSYKHQIELISVSKLLFETTNPSITVTQPQGDLGLYYRTISKFQGDEDITSIAPSTISYGLASQSTNTAVVDRLTMKQDRQYKVIVGLIAKNMSTLGNRTFTVTIKSGTTVIGEYTETIPKTAFSGGVERSYSYSIIVDNIGENTISVVLTTASISGLSYQESEVLIYTNESISMQKKTLDYVVDKILRDDLNEQQFFLDTSSQALLSKYISPEFTLTAVNKWTQLNRVADYIKAYVRAYYEDDTVTSRILVTYRLFEDLDEQVEPTNEDIEQSLSTIDDYTHAVELNAKNIVYKEGYKLEPAGGIYGTLRANNEQVTQITTNNIGLILDEPIEDIYKVEIILGKAVTDGTNTFSSSTVYDVTDLVVEKPLWETLSDDATYTVSGRASLHKCNTLYYTKGDNKILGLEYTGTKPPKLIGTEIANRTLYEMIFAKVTRETGISVTTVDNGISDDASVRWRIQYKPLSKSNVRLYKDDQSGFQAQPTRFLNEEMPINDALSLGDYAQGMVNRMGGTTKAFSGRTSGEFIPDVSTKYGDYLLVSRTLKRSGNLVDFNLNYVKDYVFVSSYEGYDLRERLYLIDNNNVVERVDKYLGQIILDVEDNTVEPLTLLYGVKEFIKHVVKTRTKAIPPSVVNITFYNSTDFKTVSTTITSKVVGKTIEWRFNMKNNYSAGMQKYTLDGKIFQKDVIYTDIFGEVLEVDVNVYKQASTVSISEANQYPAVSIGDLKMMEYSYDVRKDAREVFVNSIQFAYLSNNSDIIVYNFMAKTSDMTYNTLQSFTPGIAFLNYILDNNSKLIDLTRVEVSSNEVVHVEDSLNKGRLILSSKYWQIIPSYEEGLISWIPSEEQETYDFDEDYFEDLDAPLTEGLFARVKYTQKDWMEVASHLGDFGLIQPTLGELPMGELGDKAVVTGYDLVETDETEWDEGFEPAWVEKLSLASPYDYDISSTETLPTPLTNGLKARVRTLTWQSNTFEFADYGYIKTGLGLLPNGISHIGKKATITDAEAAITTLSFYNAATIKVDITTDSSWNPLNIDDFLFNFQNEYDMYFMDLPTFATQGAVKFDNGVTVAYWRFEPRDGEPNGYYTLNVTDTDYYESEPEAVMPREELTVSLANKNNIWFEIQDLPLFTDIPSNEDAVFKIYNGSTYSYWKFDSVGGDLTYYLYTYNGVISYGYFTSEIAPGPTYTNDSVDNANELVAWLNENHPAYLENDGVVARGSDGTLPVTYFYAISTSKEPKAVAIYDTNTLELMLVDKRLLVTHTIHYRGKKL